MLHGRSCNLIAKRSESGLNVRGSSGRLGVVRLALVLVPALLTASSALAQRTFQSFRACEPIQLSVGDAPGTDEFALANVDRENGPDIVAIDQDNDQFDVFLKLPDSECAFQDPRPHDLDGTPTAIVVADLDNDSRLDIVVAIEDDEISVFKGVGDGNFDPISPDNLPAAGDTPIGVAVADFDRSGAPDLAVLDSDDTITLLRGLGDGNFEPFSQSNIETGGTGSIRIGVGDFNGDQKQDIIVLNAGSTNLTLLLGNGDGTFADPDATAVGDEPLDMLVGFIDGLPDTRTDVAVIRNEQFSDLTTPVFLGSPRGLSSQEQASLSRDAISGTLADLDRDGNTDIVSVETMLTKPEFTAGLGDGSFLQTEDLVVSPFQNEARGISVRVADMDLDELNDIVLLAADGQSLHVYINVSDESTPTPVAATPGPTATGPQPPTGGPTPTPTPTRPPNTPVPTATATPIPTAAFGQCVVQLPDHDVSVPVAVAAGDLDGDKADDIVAADAGSTSNRIIVYLADHDGINQQSCAHVVHTPVVIPLTDFKPADLVIDELTGDSFPDIAVGGDKGVIILRGDGQGGFAAPATTPLTTNVTFLLAAKIDGDANTDIVAADAVGNTVSIMFGSNGIFTGLTTRPVGRKPVGVAVTDLNEDLLPDLTIASQVDPRLNFLIQGADRTFTFTSPQQLVPPVTALAAADVDGNRTVDLVVTRTTNDMILLEGTPMNGRLAFVADPGGPLATGDGPSAIGIAAFVSEDRTDFNHDGLADIVVANKDSSTLTFYFGTGGGSFRALVPFAVGSAPVDLAIGSFDFDGQQDVVTANSGDGSLSILRSMFPPATPTQPPTPIPTDTSTPGPTGTFTATPSATPPPPTAVGTSTPIPTNTRRGTATITPTFTNTPKGGIFELQGTCAIATPAAADEAGLPLLLPPLVLLWLRRRGSR